MTRPSSKPLPPRYTYDSLDGRSQAMLEVPEGYQPPQVLHIPLLPNLGSGYEAFVNPTPVRTTESPDHAPH